MVWLHQRTHGQSVLCDMRIVIALEDHGACVTELQKGFLCAYKMLHVLLLGREEQDSCVVKKNDDSRVARTGEQFFLCYNQRLVDDDQH